MICITFSAAFFITLTVNLGLNFLFHAQVYYLGIATIVLLAPFLLSIAYVMSVSAKHMLDKKIRSDEEEFAEIGAE